MSYRLLFVLFVLSVTMVVPLWIFIKYNVKSLYPTFEDKTNLLMVTTEETFGKIITRGDHGWRVLDSGKCARQPDFIETRLMPHNVPIFVYPPERDIHISRMIISSGSWEADLIAEMVEAMKRSPDATFIDIGANIGIYSVTMAALGYRVIAVDCFIENVMRLCVSSIYANITNKISIIHNGLSDKRAQLQLMESSEPNVGGMEVQTISAGVTSTNITSVNAVLLDDLLEIFTIKRAVIKMDVEKHEDEILKGASNFFNTVQVDCVLLEFRFHTKDKTGQFIIDFLHKYDLEPVLPEHIKRLNYSMWPGDIIFQRKRKLSK